MVEDALHHGPQYVTRRGVTTVVIVSVREYEALTTHKPTFKEFLLNCPKTEKHLIVKLGSGRSTYYKAVGNG